MSSRQQPSPMRRQHGIEAMWLSRPAASAVLTLFTVFALLMLLATLSGCGSTPSKPRSLEPTPVVTCGEHVPFEPLAAYPRIPVGAADSIATLDAYRTEQFAWAVEAAGVAERNRIRHDFTAHCLDAYRARGVIL